MQQQQPTEQKKRYEAPLLTTYGQVRTLTQGTGSGTNEAATNGNKPASDIRAKENVVRVGTHPTGFGLYLFDYKREYQDRYGAGRQFGVIADEVEQVVPDAVALNEYGHKCVDYSRLGISLALH